jgi:hypothetical protein
MIAAADRLYRLLPAIHRARDADQGHVLRALLSVIGQELGAIEGDIDRLYDNWFIETCDEWIVPYLGDLLGVRGLVPVQSAAFTQRGLVANTLAYRRRKGTAAMLEQLARDVTGWPAKVVEFFQLLATAQHMNHVRTDAPATVAVRDVNALDLIGGAFDRAAHTADVRHIDNGRGKHNIPHIGLFLWRLQSYAIHDSTPRAAADPAEGRYSFTSLGYDAPLFTRQQSEREITQRAEEINVPGPIRPLALQADLAQYQAIAARDRPPDSAYYGPGSSLHIAKDGVSVSPLDVVCMDLQDWSRPPVAVTGTLSGALAPFPSLTSAAPAVDVTIGGFAPRTATLAAVPATLSDAASLLEAAIRAAAPVPAFQNAGVIVVGERLLVLPGTRGAGVAFAATASDPTTIDEMALAPSLAQAARGVLSGELSPFPQLTAARPELTVTIGGSGPGVLRLDPAPVDLGEARARLEAAIRAADLSVTFADAEAVSTAGRLLVVPGIPGDAIRFGPTGLDQTTVRELGLGNKVAVDAGRGRLAFAVGDEPRARVAVSFNYGFSGDIGGGPYDRRQRQNAPANGQGVADTVANPGSLDVLIRVPSAGIETVADALARWDPAAAPRAVIQIEDSRTYAGDIAISMAGTELVIQAANTQRPTLIGDIGVTGGSTNARIELNGLLISGHLHVEGLLETLKIAHCTLVPGRSLDPAGEPQTPDQPSLTVESPNDRLSVEIVRSIVGPLQLPVDVSGLRIQESIVDAPVRGRPAHIVPALISGAMGSVSLTSPHPTLVVTIGEEGSRLLRLPRTPATLAEAAMILEHAMRSVAGSAAFQAARVAIAQDPGGGRLVIVPGIAAPVTVGASGADPTAAELRLDHADARPAQALVSGPLEPFPALTTATPSLRVVMGAGPTRTIAVTPAPTTLAAAATRLQDALRAAAPGTEAFDAALCAVAGGQLVVLPGTGDVVALFGTTPDDPTTARQLALETDRAAIAASAAGERPGPPTILDQVTVLGAAHVRELTSVSESIVTGPLMADRRQVGCVRFSYLPAGSRTPTRHRCQPELAAQKALEATRATNPSMTASEEEQIMRDTQLRLTPTFTSMRYGTPAYAQLSLRCAEEIQTGAEDENEMGAFHMLQQAQRIANLRASLEEYLRFGLEAGILLVN